MTDDNVGVLYRERLEAILASAGHKILPSITVNAGDSSKNYNTLQSVLNKMMANGIDRKSVVVALGGGMVGDLAGFAASIVLRGIDFVQIPTTLLAQVDSSVGGKTGIHSGHGKNTIGTFYQPKLVIIDVALLDSLPKRETLAGYAEIIKYGLINDEPFFRWCKANGERLLKGDREAQIYAIAASCKNKAEVVGADERESGIRALLNLGHTFAHALETATGYSDKLLHGEAVAIGVVMAFRLSAQLGFCPHDDAYEVRDYYAAAGLPVTPKPFIQDLDRLIRLMKQDKKAEDGKLTLILTRGIGKTFVTRDVKESDVRDLWQQYAQE
jgi:3-dehydroquinate synthase